MFVGRQWELFLEPNKKNSEGCFKKKEIMSKCELLERNEFPLSLNRKKAPNGQQ